MGPERYQRVKEIFQAAVELSAEPRATFLDEACQSDAELRAEVESLIASHSRASSFIEAPAFAPGELLQSAEPSLASQRIGVYKLLREVGHGGMGTVYLAVRADDQFQKRVAIKLVRRGMDTRDIVRRFHHERQILAALDHPNIGRLLDGGTTADGLPYFVMEYIEGKPVDEYCDLHRLSTVERLKLFRMVCSALHYAHQNLVVHRDLKPGNILVTADGVPKLLDFGIAKLLNPEMSSLTIDPTATALRLMTPDYASPEQILGVNLTTASDVYSLGVLLYRLLTGHPPYRFKSTLPQEIERVVCGTEPEKPSTIVTQQEEIRAASGPVTLTPELVSSTRERQPDKLRRRLVGDLDNIVLMAMRKEPHRRYASVAEFSEDIGRYLDGLPVRARQDTFAYRGGKFIRRHKVGAAAAALLLLTLIGGLIGIAWQARVAEFERAKAERRFNEVRKLANSLMFQLHDQIANLPGSTRARETLVAMALEYLDRLAQEAGDDASLQRELIVAYQKVGAVRGLPTNANLGDTAGALASYQKALALAEALVRAHPSDRDAQRSLGVAYEKMGELQSWTGQVAAAVENTRQALALYQALADADPANVNSRQTLAIGHIKLGDLLGNPHFPNLGDRTGTLDHYHQSLVLFQALAASDSANATIRRYLALIHERIGTMELVEGKHAAALDDYRQSLSIWEALSADNPANATARRDVAVGYEKIADVLLATGGTAGAFDHYHKALSIFEALSAADPNNTEASVSLAIEYEKMADALVKTGNVTGALDNYRKSHAIREALSTVDPTNVQKRRDLAVSCAKLGDFDALSEHWRQTRSRDQHSLNSWIDLWQRSALQISQPNLPAEVSEKIAQCDASLARSGKVGLGR
jgi:serine/threonine protein kinase